MIEVHHSKKELASEIRSFGNCNIDILDNSIDNTLVREASKKSQERLNYSELYGIRFDSIAFSQHKIDYFTILLKFLKRVKNQKGIKILQAYLDLEQDNITYNIFLARLDEIKKFT